MPLVQFTTFLNDELARKVKDDAYERRTTVSQIMRELIIEKYGGGADA